MNEQNKKEYQKNRLIEEPENTKLLEDNLGISEDDAKNLRIRISTHTNNNFNLALNRIFNFVELADKEIMYDNVKVFWLLAMAEIVIKAIKDRFEDSKESSKDVKNFFQGINDSNKNILIEGLKLSEPTLLDPKGIYFCRDKQMHYEFIYNMLLNVRHRVVHGKMHYNFSFFNQEKFPPEQNSALVTIFTKIFDEDQSFVLDVSLTYQEFRKILISESVNMIKKNL